LLILLITILLGLGAAVLRGFQLTSSFDPRTALIEPGDPLTVSLMALSFAFGAAVIGYAFIKRGKEYRPKRLGVFWQGAAFAALAALLVSSGHDLFMGFFDQGARLGLISLGFLGLFSAAALLMIALKINALDFSSITGFWATIPVFWACLVLITDYWGQMGNPVRNAYVYGMIGTVCCALALYALAGFFFDKVKPARFLLFALPGVFFTTLTAGGAVIGRLLGEPIFPPSFPALFRLIFIALHLSAMTAAVLCGRFTPPDAPPETGGSPADTEESLPDIGDIDLGIDEEGA
jgi:hypothetical protein